MAKKKITKASYRAAAKTAARIADDMKASEIEVFDLVGLFDLAEYFIIATCTSTRHQKAVSDEIKKELKKRGLSMLGLENSDGAGWLLLDFNSIIVHLFLPDAREYYGLETLWGDAERVDW